MAPCVVLGGGILGAESGGVGMGQITKGLADHSREVGFNLEGTGNL